MHHCPRHCHRCHSCHRRCHLRLNPRSTSEAAALKNVCLQLSRGRGNCRLAAALWPACAGPSEASVALVVTTLAAERGFRIQVQNRQAEAPWTLHGPLELSCCLLGKEPSTADAARASEIDGCAATTFAMHVLRQREEQCLEAQQKEEKGQRRGNERQRRTNSVLLRRL